MQLVQQFEQLWNSASAPPDDTDTRILRGPGKGLNEAGRRTGSRIRENSDESGNDRILTNSATGLAETLAAVRHCQGDNTSKKVVIIIDQFEQWLHAHRAEPDAELVRALGNVMAVDIKGHMQLQAELLAASGSQDRPSECADLLRILDGELRLITPTDPKGAIPGEPDASASRAVTPGSVTDNSPAYTGGSPRYCQLTHDILVPSLREWLTRKQKETRLLSQIAVSRLPEELKPLVAEGWRPFTIAVDSGGARSAPSSALPGTFSPWQGGEGARKAG